MLVCHCGHFCALYRDEAFLFGKSNGLKKLLHDLTQQLYLHAQVRLIDHLVSLHLPSELINLGLDNHLAPALSFDSAPPF